MVHCKITVIKKDLKDDLVEEYCDCNVTTCPCFDVGQEFVTGLEKPENFCDWAWNDILRFVTVIVSGGNFSKDIFQDWMKDDKTMIACCTDAIRPVTFKIERIDS